MQLYLSHLEKIKSKISENSGNEMADSKDVFDKLMELPGLRLFNPFYKKHKQVLLYLLFGGVAFFLNLILFFLFVNRIGINELVANAIAWLICATFQFFTNRTWAFNGVTDNKGDLVKQIISFYGSCLFTLILEEIIIAVFITWLGFNTTIVKLVAQVVVIVLNYILRKFFVFKKN